MFIQRHIKLRYVLIFLIVILLIAVVLTGFFSYLLFSDNMVMQIAKSRVDLLDRISVNLGTIKKSMSTISDIYYHNTPINGLLKNEKLKDSDINNILNGFYSLNYQNKTALKNKDVEIDYVVAMENGFSYSTKNGQASNYIELYKKRLWYRDIVKESDKIVWISTYDDVISKEEDYVFSGTRCIKLNNNVIGIFLVSIPESYISSIYESAIKENSIYIIDLNGRIVSHHRKDLLGFSFYNMKVFYEMFDNRDYNIIEKSGEKYLFSKSYNKDFNWIIVEEIPLKNILTPLLQVRNIFALIIIVILFLGIIFSLFVVRTILKPLYALCNGLEQVGRGKEEVRFDIKGWNEINKISEECNCMMYRLDNLIKSEREIERKKRKAELDFLQMQINPHFLYNTLFSIKCLVSMSKNEAAEKMISSLITFLKSVLGASNDLITLDMELDILKEYVYIQKYRFGDKFDVVYNYDSHLLKCKIPRLLLQPLVENAIVHGIEPLKNTKGVITIEIKEIQDNISINIIDNGVGMSVCDHNQDLNITTTSIGIANVVERIKLNFGEKYTLKIESLIGKGTKVNILIPVKF